jgi:zinc/manganese transport system substrate-binding protein
MRWGPESGSQGPSAPRRLPLVAGLLAAGALLLAACSSSSTPAGGASSTNGAGPVVHVVAAENFWGSIASQIGGKHAQVVSIITNPNTDPHSYEPTAANARTVAGAQFVIENGIGYDPWVPRFLAADQGHPTVLDVGDLLGVADGGNPHRWYNPTDVQTVIAQMVNDFQKLDPADTAYFTEQHNAFDTVALKKYNATIVAIKENYSGTPVGASESIFSMLAPALGLNLVTPYSFLKAISEGTDVSAADKATIDNQIKNHLIKIYVYNSQNVTPDVQAQLSEVKAEHIPYTTITETLAPATTTYQAWQTAQLLGIQSALAKAAQGSP